MKVRNKFGEIIEIPDDAHYRSLLKSLELTPIVEETASPAVEAVPPAPTGQAQEQPNVIPIFESLLQQVPEDLTEAEEVAVFVRDLPGMENFTDTDAADFLLYRLEKKEQ